MGRKSRHSDGRTSGAGAVGCEPCCFCSAGWGQFLSAHELTVVPSVSAAKAAAAGGSFDAVLVDYGLDDGKGDGLVRFVRQMQARIPVVATSSHEDGNATLLAAGADAA